MEDFTERGINAALRRLTEETRRLRMELAADVGRPAPRDDRYRHERFHHYLERDRPPDPPDIP